METAGAPREGVANVRNQINIASKFLYGEKVVNYHWMLEKHFLQLANPYIFIGQLE
jgi:hypothetical protein